MSDLVVGCLDDEESWLDGWLACFLVGRWDSLRIFFCESRLWSICRANISDVRCPASSCCITILRVMNTKGKMFCITSVEFLMKIVKKCFPCDEVETSPSKLHLHRRRFGSQHNSLCRVLPCRPSILFDRPVLR